MHTTYDISIIISTYNSEDWLEKVLWGYENQTKKNFELILADDGSRQQTFDLIARMQKEVSYPIVHVWQEDEGFQKSRILNKAVLRSKSDYILMSDGDCIPRADFIETHLKKREEGYFLSGGYFMLPIEISKSIQKEDIISQDCFDLNWLQNKGLKNSFKNKKLTSSGFFQTFLNFITPTNASWNGHNASGWKSDILKVNGFDERMQYGGQDRELGERLVNAGVKSKQIRYSAICIHLDHPRGYKNEYTIAKNKNIREQTKREKRTWTDFGIEKKLPQSDTNETMEKLTAIIPTGNEEHNIRGVLESVDFADEIMVVDSYSTDKTVEIAKEFTDFILQRKYEYSASQKNWAIPQATHEWILLVDADERVTPSLKEEIIEILKNPPQDDTVGYWIYRMNHFMGKRVKYSGWQNDKVIRLFKKSKCRYEDKMVHAEIIPDGNVKFLKNKFFHNTYVGIDKHITKLNRYASWQSVDYDKKTGMLTPYHFVIKPMWGFFKHYILRQGFRDGVVGLTIAYVQSYSIFMRYVKLWLLRRGRN
ncbi:MAG TPA: glycosyltransferase [Flavobacteriaceae bacterium]|nr:glycosyltransferase [Flavobacteriaceae bacterium]